jgi:hypothetical protein
MISATNGILITANNVSLDLMGFTLSGDGDSSDRGIVISGTAGAPLTGIRIGNGMLSDFGVGIDVDYMDASTIAGLILRNMTGEGMLFSTACRGNRINDCLIAEAGDQGISVFITDEEFSGNTFDGCTVFECADGFEADLNGTATFTGNIIRNCSFGNNTGRGIYLQTFESTVYSSGNIVQGCRIHDNRGGREMHIVRLTGILVDANMLSGTNSSEGLRIYFSDGGNIITRNRAIGHNPNYALDSDDTYGPIVTNTGSMATSGDDAHPWANFSL